MAPFKVRVQLNKNNNQLFINIPRKKTGIPKDKNPKFLKIRRMDFEW